MDGLHIDDDEFGPPRNDEPAGLRRDITDELNDHLECALRQELRRDDDEAAVQEAVLDRFGDPCQLARQLWWQAMKEKIVRNRILMVALGVLVLAALGASGFAWASLQQTRETNQALLAALQDLKGSSPASQVWARPTFQIVNDLGERKPVPNAEVKLYPLHSEGATYRGVTDSAGRVSFGWISIDTYEAALPNGAHPYVTIQPDQDADVVLPCPPLTDVRVRVDGLPSEVENSAKLSFEFRGPFGPTLVQGREIYNDGAIRQFTIATVVIRGKATQELGNEAKQSIAAGLYRLDELVVEWTIDKQGFSRAIHLPVPTSFVQAFEARAGEPNEWVIKLPPDAVEKVEKALGPTRRQ